MRITGGKNKGRILASPRNLRIRPTSDQVREALFNILGHDLTGHRVLDLFAGTGSLGLEALSRGAEKVVFVDHTGVALGLIRKNLERCGFTGSGIVLKWDLTRGIGRHGRLRGQFFDLVFLDPPYGKNMITPLLQELSTTAMLSPGARVVAESSKSDGLPSVAENLKQIDHRIYGDTQVSLYGLRRKNE